MSKKTQKEIITLVGFIISVLVSLGVIVLPHTAPKLEPGLYHVIKVVDGDTLDVQGDNGESIKLRLIGINTPETVDPRKPVECFGKQASDQAKNLLMNKDVKLEFDSTQDAKDKYGRTLAYVVLEDGTNFNKKMIEDGYAYEYTYDKPYKYQQEFKAAQKYAEEHKLGLWAPGMCEKKTS